MVLIEDPARLVRFGFSYLEEAFRGPGVRLEVLDPPMPQEPTEELVQDLLTIVSVEASEIVRPPCKACPRAGQGRSQDL